MSKQKGKGEFEAGRRLFHWMIGNQVFRFEKKAGRRFIGKARYDQIRGPPWLALYTAIPVTWLTPVFAGAGLSRMRFGLFCTAVGLGFVPRAGLFAVAGRAAVAPSVRNVSLAVAFGVAALVGTLLARRWLSARPSASD